MLETVVEQSRAILGPEHPDTLTRINNLANEYVKAGRVAAASPLLEEVLRVRRRKLDPHHPDALLSMSNLAYADMADGRIDEAIALYQEILAAQGEARTGSSRRRQHPRQPGPSLSRRRPRRRCDPAARAGRRAAEVEAGPRAPRHDQRTRPARCRLPGCETVRRRRGRATRMPGAPRQEGAGPLATLPDDEPSRGRAGRPEEVCRSRAAAGRGFRGSAGPRETAPGTAEGRAGRRRARIVAFYEAWGRSAEAANWRKRLATIADKQP